MIFVTVGTHYQGFERLVRKMDEIAGKIDEDVIMQIGYTKYVPKNVNNFFNFIDEKEISSLYQQARVIVSHAGSGTVIEALKFRKPLVVVPRLRRFSEHIDDQQLELARALSMQGRAIVVYNIEELEGAFKHAENLRLDDLNKDKRLIMFLRSYIERLGS